MQKMNYFIKRMSIVLTCFWAVIFSADAKTNYVSDLTGNDTNNGTSWAQAYKTISNGVAAANAVAGDTILVTNGTYTLTTQIVIVRSNTTLQSVNGRDYTFINGNYPTTTNRCIYSMGYIGVVIDGFTITNGFASSNAYPGVGGAGGGGIKIQVYGSTEAFKSTIKNCTFSKNQANHDVGSWNQAGAVWCVGFIVVSNCIISYNTGLNEIGGGIAGNNRGPVINCDIFSNTAAAYGGGAASMYNLENCRIYGNSVGWSAGVGGGIFAATNIRNCIVWGNSAAYGGGIGWSSDIRNCLVWGNTSSVQGGGIHYGTTFSVTINNDINGIRNCTIVSNYAGNAVNSGGGVYYNGTNNYIYNSILREPSSRLL